MTTGTQRKPGLLRGTLNYRHVFLTSKSRLREHERLLAAPSAAVLALDCDGGQIKQH